MRAARAAFVLAALLIASTTTSWALDCANPRGKKLSGAELEDVLRRHDAWYRERGWRIHFGVDVGRLEHRDRAKLCNTDLRGLNLSGASLSGADLRRAILKGVDLSRAFLSGALLRSADLTEANLEWASLSEANLVSARLSGAKLSGADLSKAVLNSADLSGAVLDAVPDEDVGVRLQRSKERFASALESHLWAVGVAASAGARLVVQMTEEEKKARKRAWDTVLLYHDALIAIAAGWDSEQSKSAVTSFEESAQDVSEELGERELPIIRSNLAEASSLFRVNEADPSRDALLAALVATELLVFELLDFLTEEIGQLTELQALEAAVRSPEGSQQFSVLHSFSRPASARKWELSALREEISRPFDAPPILRPANLSAVEALSADFAGASLKGAYLHGANLAGADLTGADLSASTLDDANFADSSVFRTEFAGAALDKAKLDDVILVGARGLSDILVADPVKVAELRQIARRTGLRQEERALTAALRKFSLSRESGGSRFAQRWILGGQVTDFGANPTGSLIALPLLILVFWPAYICAFHLARSTETGRSGIYKVWNSDRVVVLPDQPSKERLRLSLMRSLPMGLYFSLLSAFHIGWREINVGNWILRLHPGEYVLRPVGWVKVVSGAQSLVSVYFLALWALTYFGRPFE